MMSKSVTGLSSSSWKRLSAEDAMPPLCDAYNLGLFLSQSWSGVSLATPLIPTRSFDG